jgi:hypothetical protein
MCIRKLCKKLGPYAVSNLESVFIASSLRQIV